MSSGIIGVPVLESKTERAIPEMKSVGINIGKEVFRLVGFGLDGKVAFRRRSSALDLPTYFASCRFAWSE